MFKHFVSDTDQYAVVALRKAVIVVGGLFWLTGWAVAITSPTQPPLVNALCWSAGPVAWLAMALGLVWQRWRWGAWSLMVGWFAVISTLGWLQGLSIAGMFLNLVTMVAFAGWALGWPAAVGWAVVCAAVGLALRLRGTATMQEALPLLHGMLLTVWILRQIHENASAQIADAQRSLRLIQTQSQQLTLLSEAVDQIPEALAITDLEGRLFYTNRAFARQSGCSQREALGQNIHDVYPSGLSTDDLHRVRQMVSSGQVWSSVLHNLRPGGRVAIEQVSVAPVHDAAGVLTHVVLISQDVKERLDNEKRIDQLQNLDEVTQLPNLPSLMRRIDGLLMQQSLHQDKSVEGGQRWHGLVAVEIDRFSDYLDAHGWAVMEKLRQAVARKLEHFASEGAWLSNTAPERFVLLYEHMGRSHAHALRRMREISQEVQCAVQASKGWLDGLEPGAMGDLQLLSCSCGVVVFALDDERVQSEGAAYVVRIARVALKKAKAMGGGHMQVYTEDLAESLQRKAQIEGALYLALQSESAQSAQLQLYVQPQVDWAERVQSVEALVRWNHPQHGWIGPGEFVPLAEAAGLIVPLGEWVLARVCELLQRPEVAAGGYGVSANVSALQLAQPSFIPKLKALLQRTGIQPDRLTLEITESAMLDDVQQVMQKMRDIQALGVQLALDDFGTGYSSLSYLQQLPIHEIKLDQSFIRDLDPTGVSGAVVEAVLMVASRKGLRVVAEGVETQDQADLLRAWEPGVLCQGYWISKPIALAQWLEDPQLQQRRSSPPQPTAPAP